MSVTERAGERIEAVAPNGTVTVATHVTDSADTRDVSRAINAGAETESVAPPKPVPVVALRPGAFLSRFERWTGVLGVAFLVIGLAVWRFKPHTQDRLALLILVVAMFLAILHHYTIEEGRSGKP